MASPPEPQKPTRREEQKAQTRRLVLECAYGLFEEKGYEKATMRELAARAGVGLGTIFKHFPDKSALLAAAFEDDLGRAVEASFASLPDADLATRFLHLVRDLYEFYARRPSLSRVMITRAAAMEGRSAETIWAQLQEFQVAVGELVQAGIERGELCSDVDRDDVAVAFFSFYYAGLVASFMGPGFPVEDRVEGVGRMIEQHLRGIGAPKA
jgi:AcrR family transcriptional regulator